MKNNTSIILSGLMAWHIEQLRTSMELTFFSKLRCDLYLTDDRLIADISNCLNKESKLNLGENSLTKLKNTIEKGALEKKTWQQLAQEISNFLETLA
jgi:hypothetical protein